MNWAATELDLYPAVRLLGSENNTASTQIACHLKDHIKLNGKREPGHSGLTRGVEYVLHRLLDAIVCFGFDWTQVARHVGLDSARREILVERKWQWLVRF